MTPISRPKEPDLKCGAPETHLSGQSLVANASLEVHPSQEPSHEIFLSHSGSQKEFAEQLYHEFENEGYFPFFDQESHALEKGKEFPLRIFQVARECKVAVIILTKQFLSSKWPMLELLTFVDAQKERNRDMHLLPVLFNGLKVEKLYEHFWTEEWNKLIQIDSERRHSTTLTLEKRAEALQKLRKVNMLDIKNYNGSSYRLCKAIVECALRLLPQDSDTDMKDIQGAGRLSEILLRLFQDTSIQSNGVKYLGLYGMGGLGKTTLCKALCSHFSSEFGSKVFHVEFGGHDEQHRLDRQKKLLQKLTPLGTFAIKIQDLSANEVIMRRPQSKVNQASCNLKYNFTETGLNPLSFKTLDETIDRLKKRLKGVPVFLAVDNVQDDEASRQEARIFLECISCPGSKVLITSRSQDILNTVLHDVSCCKPIPNLNESEAMELFLKIAAPQIESTSLNVKEIQVLRECLKCCYFTTEESVAQITVNNTTSGNHNNGHYHPLALRSVASFLQDRFVNKSSILNWKKNLEDPSLMLYHSRESKDIFNILGLDFDSLCPKGKQLFLDVAVFASTETISDPRRVFDYLLCIHGKSERDWIDIKISELRRKSFLSYDEHTGITTHDLYREFGQRYLANSSNNEFGVCVEKSNFKGGTNWSFSPRVLLRACKTQFTRDATMVYCCCGTSCTVQTHT